MGLSHLELCKPQKKDKTSCDQEACEQFLSFLLQVLSFREGGGPPQWPSPKHNTEPSLLSSFEK